MESSGETELGGVVRWRTRRGGSPGVSVVAYREFGASNPRVNLVNIRAERGDIPAVAARRGSSHRRRPRCSEAGRDQIRLGKAGKVLVIPPRTVASVSQPVGSDTATTINSAIRSRAGGHALICRRYAAGEVLGHRGWLSCRPRAFLQTVSGQSADARPKLSMAQSARRLTSV